METGINHWIHKPREKSVIYQKCVVVAVRRKEKESKLRMDKVIAFIERISEWLLEFKTRHQIGKRKPPLFLRFYLALVSAPLVVTVIQYNIYGIIYGGDVLYNIVLGFILISMWTNLSAPFCIALAWILYKTGFNKYCYQNWVHTFIISAVAWVIEIIIMPFSHMYASGPTVLKEFSEWINSGYSGYIGYFQFFFYVALLLFMEGLVIQMYKFIKRMLFKKQV